MESESDDFKVVRKQLNKFGTEVDLQIILEKDKCNNNAEKVLSLAVNKLDCLEKIFSRFDKKSELSKLNSNLGKFNAVSREIREVINLCLEFYNKTSGYFDPRIIQILEEIGYGTDFSEISKTNFLENEKNIVRKRLEKDLFVCGKKVKSNLRLDLAGIAKGWFVDEIAKLFTKKGYGNFVVDIGGDMYFSGNGLNEEAWYIDIEGVDYQKIMLSLSEKAVATSGIGKRKWEIDGKRFHHLINPVNPQEFSFELKSVTVVANKTYEADVMAKTVFLMGKERGMEFCKQNKLACVILDYRGNAFVSNEMKKYIFK